MDPNNSPLHDAVSRTFADDEIPDRLLKKAVELMLDRGVQIHDITIKLLEWAAIAACEADKPDVWQAAFRQTGDLIAEWKANPSPIGPAAPSE